VEDLEATRDPGSGELTLHWTAPGDDWLCGTADAYRVITSDSPIDEPSDGDALAEEDAADGAGATVERAFASGDVGDAAYAAVLYRDEAGNWGILKSVAIPPLSGPEDCENEVLGTDAGEALPGTPGPDMIRGLGGRDEITAGAGNDCAKGGKGRDSVKGQGDEDVVTGGKNADRVSGGSGDDKVRGNQGGDNIRGGSGDDEIRDLSKGRDRINCGAGNDTAAVRGNDKVRNCEDVTRR
jgi:Ca2+-binding RTX toxin-like protein